MIVALASTVLTGCGSAEFNGDTGPGNALDVKTSRPSQTIENDGGLPVDDPYAAATENSSEPPVPNAANNSSIANNSSNATPGGPINLLESVDFGDGTMYRIGDGIASKTECMEDIQAYKDSYKKYTFNFQVLAADTTVKVELQKLCGVDTSTNYARVKSQSGTVQQTQLKTKQADVNFAAVVLQPGSYSIEVESQAIPDGAWKGQFDDFIVGAVRLRADKKLNPGTIEAK